MTPRPTSSSTSGKKHATLHLNAFRGEPAITEFDWPFTPTHRESPWFSTLVGSGLHANLPAFHPAHAQITPLRVYSTRLNALFRLAFATATRHRLTSPRTVTRRLILQKARRHPEGLRRLVGTRVQVLFHDPSPGCFSPFPHGTSSLSVTREYLGLGGGPPRFTRDFSGPVLLGISLGSRVSAAYGAVTLCAGSFQNLRLPKRFLTSCRLSSSGWAVPLARSRNACWLSHVVGLAYSHFAHHYSGNRGCFLFLWVLRCFPSPRYLPLPYVFRQGRRAITPARFPHSEIPGSKSGCRLPGAYRRLLRPSSAPGAKASTVRP